MGITADWLTEKANQHLADCPYGSSKATLDAADKAVIRAVADYLDETSRERGTLHQEQFTALHRQLERLRRHSTPDPE